MSYLENDGYALPSYWIMSRPTTAQDVVELVRRSGLIGEADLSRFLTRITAELTPTTVVAMMVAEGMLTRYQAEELIGGRSQSFWLGAYKILDRLGKGGMGQVYLAEHTVLGKRVAVKVLSAALRSDPSARRRFVREARAAAAIEHPNVVHVFDVDMDHDPPFLVMEHVDGISLQAAVARHGTFKAGETALVGAEVARGLQAAAAAGLVHRDVKPANLLIDRRGGVKILDLGIVRLAGDETHPQTDASDVILGTLDYLAPEQAEDSTTVDARADLYALGATLYFLLAGHPPFPGDDLRHKLAAKQYSDPPPVHRLRPDVDAALSEVIQKLLTRDPAGRYQTAAEVVAVLGPFAVLPPDFPSRLFRSNHPSTISDIEMAPEPDPLPPTQRILKPNPRPRPGEVCPTPTPRPDPAVTDTSQTDELIKAPTAIEMTPLPKTAVERAQRLEPSQHPIRRWEWWMIVVLAILAGIALARVLW